MLQYIGNKVKHLQCLTPMENPITRLLKSFFGANQMSFRQYMKNMVVRFKEDSLFKNSVYLITSTIAMSLFGFAFWIITTRLYTTSQIGFATALISTTILLSTFSLFGFNTSIVRFLPKSENQNRTINTAITVVTLITIVIATVYVLSIGRIAPQFDLLKKVPAYGVFFVFFMILVSINMLTDSIFIAFRAAKYIFIEYIFFGIAKISLPLLLVSLGTYGVFFAYTGSVIVALIVTLYYLVKKFRYSPKVVISKTEVKNVGLFAVGNYAATFILGLPLLILPTIIVTTMGATESAYFYIASTIAALLYGIPVAICQSLLAEGSYDERALRRLVKSAAKLLGVIILLGIGAFIALSKFVLLIFGRNYAANSRNLLIVMAIAAIFVAINNLGETVLRIHRNIKTLVWISIGFLIATIAFIFLLISHGILGMGWALLLGQAFMSVELGVYFSYRKVKNALLFYLLGRRTWKDIEYFDSAWSDRIGQMAQYIPAGASILDLGCGKMLLQQYLELNHTYYPVDYKDRGEGTIVCNFNRHHFPDRYADIAFVSGVLEYVENVPVFIADIAKHTNQCILSYCLIEDFPNISFRRKQAWVNAFSRDDIISLFSQAGFVIKDESKTPSNNSIFNFVKQN
ncbi:MAG TPA: oligosaccharide flippase family protein [Candidatus Paceibacterota bacterium]|jgi:O-antigen/teichoic acid export membrane protein|nr:oligosaccharide flippase family protein [Candidatus Paceibacterota bacterium]